MAKPTLDKYQEVLRYDPEEGQFYWVKHPKKESLNGCSAGYMDNKGYMRINALGYSAPGHRLAFLFMTGNWPVDEVDHKNCNRFDNRWVNLRETDRCTNQQNLRGPLSNNKCGFLGVMRSQNKKRFVARIEVDGVSYQVGTFDTPEEAHAAYVEAKRKYHKGCTL